MPKVLSAENAMRLTDIPNIGPATAADLRSIGIATPDDVRRMNPLTAYDALCSLTGQRHDSCVLDVFMAAGDFMNGAAARPWWAFTPCRKALLAKLKH